MSGRHRAETRRLRLLLYAGVHPAHRGGVQAVFMRLGDHLRRRGHRVTRTWRAANPLAEQDAVCPLPLLVHRGPRPTLRSSLGAIRALTRLALRLVRMRPHVVNVHYVTAEAAYFALLKPLLRFKLVFSVHGSDLLAPKPHNARLLPLLLPRADVITTVSALTAAKVRDTPDVDARRVRIVPNGVDHAFWGERAGGAELRSSTPSIVAVGRLHPIKGHDVLLHAFRRVRDRIGDARLQIIGEGGFREELERIATDLGVRDAVEFAGQLPPADVRTRYHRANVFALPSRSEGLPLSLLEAMAAGVPAVATSVGAVPEVLVAGTGLIVSPDNAPALADSLVELLVNVQRADEFRARARVHAARYAAAESDRAYEEIFLEAAAGTARTPRSPQRWKGNHVHADG